MRITITGPRSVGKSTVSKLVAKKLGLEYISSDAIGEKAFESVGGLDKAIKTGVVDKFITEGSYNLIRDVYKKDDFVFDLSGGSVTSDKFPEAIECVRKVAKSRSIVIGLLPFEDEKKSISSLFEREKSRKHFKEIDEKELLQKVGRNYRKFPERFKIFCNYVVYTGDRKPGAIAEKIAELIKKKGK
jgi:shikimate kinase